MPAPSYDITIGDRGAASPAPDDVGGLFALGLTDFGPVGAAVECLSLKQVKDAFGDVVSYSHFIRSAEAYFREGGTRFVGSRAVGPAAVKASKALSSAAPAVVVTFTAVSEGLWGNDLTITVTTTTGSLRTVVLKNDGVVVSTGTYADTTSLVDALVATGLVTAALGPGVWPLANSAEAAFTGGADDRASITQAQYDNALTVFANDDELGPGSVAAPGITSAAMHQSLLAHAQTHNRFALLDGIDTATAATLKTAAELLRALNQRAGYGQMLAPWEIIPGPGIGTVTIPPSGAVAGRLARADAENTAGPGQYGGARFGLSRFSVDVTQTYSKADRDLLSEAGVTVIRLIRGKVQTYDSVTLADPDVWPQYLGANGMRVVMAIHRQAEEALASRVLQVIDGHRHLLAAIEADLTGICMAWYERDALYGSVATEAFSADATSIGVNPDAQLALRRVSAAIELRTSESANTISLLITKVAAREAL